MFLKLFGAAFVIAGCSALGIGYGRKLNLHLEELRFLRELYRMIRGEIQYTKEPFPEVMLEVSCGSKSRMLHCLYRHTVPLKSREAYSFPNGSDPTHPGPWNPTGESGG